MRIQRYLAKEIVLAFAVSFLVFFFLFFLNQILLLAEDVLKKRAPFDQVLILIIASLPSILALTAPFASLLGILLSVGRLAGDKEILAMQASGIPHRQLFFPVAALGLLFTIGSYLANDVLLPAGAVTFNRVYRELLLSTPELELGSYSVKFYKNFFIVTGRVDGRTVHGISLLDRTSQDNRQLITAKTARIVEDSSLPGVLIIRFDYNIVLRDLVPSAPEVGPKEMQSFDLARQIAQKEKDVARAQSDLIKATAKEQAKLSTLWWAARSDAGRAAVNDSAARLAEMRSRDLSDQVLSSWKTEYYQKFSIPLACLCFVFLAYPLGVVLQRRGLTGIIGLGLLTAVGFWASLLLARTLALEWAWPPELALFLPDIMIVGGAIPLLLRLRR